MVIVYKVILILNFVFMFYRGPQVYQFFHHCPCLPSLNKGVTLPYLTLQTPSLMYMNLLLSRMTSFSFQIKVNVMNMREAKVQEVGHHPKARKSPYLLIKV